MEVQYMLLGGCLIAGIGLGVGVLIGRFIYPVLRGVSNEEHSKILFEVTRMTDALNFAEKQLEQCKADYQSADTAARASREESVRLNEKVLGLTNKSQELAAENEQLAHQNVVSGKEAKEALAEVARLKEREQSLLSQAEELKTHGRVLDTQIEALKRQKDDSHIEVRTLSEEVSRLQEREKALLIQITELKQQLVDLQTRLTVEFENIANRILKANATELTQTSHDKLDTVVKPLRDRIEEFQKKVEDAYGAEFREVLSLKEQIKLMQDTSNTIGSQADGLAKALRGDSQLRGRWGELKLERILECAGLTEGIEFFTQGKGLNLRSEGGGVQKPDVVLLLPPSKAMIIDSKAPLAAYDRLVASKPEESSQFADQLVDDFKGHIDDLSGKKYQNIQQLEAHDYVLMFIPIEGALAAALTRDPELFLYAWNKNVVLVGPPTLLMTARTVHSVWQYEKREKNAQEIARLAGQLCDKLSASVADMNIVAAKIQDALEAHNDAAKRLASGKGNALSIGQRIRKKTGESQKEIPQIKVDGVLTAPDSDDEELEGVA